VTLLEVLDRSAEKVGERFRDQPEVEAEVRSTIASAYHGLGSYLKAARQAEACLSLVRARPGLAGQNGFVILGQIGHYQSHLGQNDRAIESLRQAVAGLSLGSGPDDPDTLVYRGYLGSAYVLARRQAEAVPILEETLQLMRARQGADSPDTRWVLFTLATAYESVGREAEATSIYEDLARKYLASFGPESPRTITVRFNLAQRYTNIGRVDEAIAILEENSRICRARLGPEQPLTLAC
jgi:tetratricopeptide (TPR) repeat protein